MTYNSHADLAASYTLALRMIALRMGVVRFATVTELYWAEAHGAIP